MMSSWQKYRQKKQLRKWCSSLRSRRHNDDDILPEATKEKLAALQKEGDMALAHPEEREAFWRHAGADLERIWPRGRFSTLREWLDVLAVAMAVAFGIRGLFFQPFKIPTSSMQPTLFGIHYIEKEPEGNAMIGRYGALFDKVAFASDRAKLELKEEGLLTQYQAAGGPFSTKTRLQIGDYSYTLPGDFRKIEEYTGVAPYYKYRKGQLLCDGFLSNGDHLFVDRVSHYLTGLKRGDVVVFTTEGIKSGEDNLADVSGFYYIKRLVGLPGDTLKIVDGNLLVKPEGEDEFRHIKTFSPQFDKVYSGKGGYQGHSNIVGYSPGKFLGDSRQEFKVPRDSYFMLGDNTKFSADSRIWGVVPRENIIGKALWVFWPFSRRWGVADHTDALDIPTTASQRATFKEMYQQ